MKQERILADLDEQKKTTQAAIENFEKQHFDVVDFLEPTDPLSRQLSDLIAEENA